MLTIYRRYLFKSFKFLMFLVIIFTFTQAILQLWLPRLMSQIVNRGVQFGDIDYIIRVGTTMLIVTAIATLCTILTSLFAAKISVGLGSVLRSKVFRKVESFSLDEFDQLGTATLITRTTNDIVQIQNVTNMILRMLLLAPLTAVGGIYMAISTDAKLSLIFLASIPALIITIIIVGKKGIPLFTQIQRKLDNVNLVAREGLTGMRVVRAFNKTNYEEQRFDEANTDLTNTTIKVNRIMASLMPFIMLVMQVTSIAVVWFGAFRIDNLAELAIRNGKNIEDISFQVGDLMAFIQYGFQIMFSFLMVSMMFIMIPRAAASANRIVEVLNVEAVINDPDSPVHEQLSGYVEFNDVSFNFHGAEEPAIKNISFKAKPGEVTAIIGGTGSGKSTIVNMIPRFYDVTEGKVLVDGVAVEDLRQIDLRQKIGFVPQKAVLFSGTIAENIRYGNRGATDEEVEHAAKVAQATEFISEMKDGFNSKIAQGGNNLSGGQKQRLSIARALVRKPEIYIFDDSFSALDFKTDARLRAALKEETTKSTVLIVAQRVMTIMDADRIIVLDQGEIVGVGKHDELLKTCEIYQEIVASQLSEEELNHE